MTDDSRLDRIETKVDTVTTNVAGLQTSIATLVEKLSDYPDLKKDVDSLKCFKAWFIGIVSVGGVSGGGIVAYFKSFAASVGNLPN